MKRIRKALALLLAAVMIAGLSSCGGSGDESGTKLKIVQQYGMAYAPFKIMQEKQLIEKYYDGVEVEWSVLNSGQAINEGFASGDIDIGAMGLAPVITGVTSGVPYKICSGVSAQPNRLMTSSKKVKSLKDIGKKKIALVNIGSIQHIILAMAAEKEPASIIAAQLRHADGGALAQRVYIHQLPQTAPRLAEVIEGVFGPEARNGRAVSAERRAEGNRRETRPSNPT